MHLPLGPAPPPAEVPQGAEVPGAERHERHMGHVIAWRSREATVRCRPGFGGRDQVGANGIRVARNRVLKVTS